MSTLRISNPSGTAQPPERRAQVIGLFARYLTAEYSQLQLAAALEQLQIRGGWEAIGPGRGYVGFDYQHQAWLHVTIEADA